MTTCAINPPDEYSTWLAGQPNVLWDAPEPGRRFTHLFTAQRTELESRAALCRQTMARDGMLWVSWPKKSSKVPTDITEDVVREVCLPIGLVDVKVCAVSETWSGLKLVIRKELR